MEFRIFFNGFLIHKLLKGKKKYGEKNVGMGITSVTDLYTHTHIRSNTHTHTHTRRESGEQAVHRFNPDFFLSLFLSTDAEALTHALLCIPSREHAQQTSHHRFEEEEYNELCNPLSHTRTDRCKHTHDTHTQTQHTYTHTHAHTHTHTHTHTHAHTHTQP